MRSQHLHYTPTMDADWLIALKERVVYYHLLPPCSAEDFVGITEHQHCM